MRIFSPGGEPSGKPALHPDTRCEQCEYATVCPGSPFRVELANGGEAPNPLLVQTTIECTAIADIDPWKDVRGTVRDPRMELQWPKNEVEALEFFLDFDNGDRYAGQLLAGQPHGQGAYLFANGERYLGDFHSGDYHGQGLFTFADGSRYLGQWSGGRFHGRGILYTPDGKVERDGDWNQGLPLREK